MSTCIFRHHHERQKAKRAQHAAELEAQRRALDAAQWPDRMQQVLDAAPSNDSADELGRAERQRQLRAQRMHEEAQRSLAFEIARRGGGAEPAAETDPAPTSQPASPMAVGALDIPEPSGQSHALPAQATNTHSYRQQRQRRRGA